MGQTLNPGLGLPVVDTVEMRQLTQQLPQQTNLNRRAVASKLVAAYETQAGLDAIYGPRLLPRSGLPLANDTPAITGITTEPSADADAAAQTIYPFGSNLSNTDYIAAAACPKTYLRGFSQGLRKRGYGGFGMRMSSAISSYAVNGNQDTDATTGWGISKASPTVTDVYLDGDVLFLKSLGGVNYEFYVNGSLVTVAPGSGVTQASGRMYALGSNGYFKLKFPTAARRRIQIMGLGTSDPASFHLRATHTLVPAVPTPITWVHMGDSFSTATGASTGSRGLEAWLQSAFGYDFDFINAAEGGTGFANTGMAAPGDSWVSGLKMHTRLQYLTHVRANPDIRIFSFLIGHNDGASDMTAVAREALALVQQIKRDYPSALVFFFTSNTSPGLISGSLDVKVENTLLTTLKGIEGVMLFPIQTNSDGAFLRGSGKVGGETGMGNTDLLTGTDGIHPSDLGHKAWGQMMAARIYEAVKQIL